VATWPAVGAFLLAAFPAAAAADLEALRRDLAGGDLEAMAQAAEGLEALGPAAAPAVEDLRAALRFEFRGPIPRHLEPLRQVDRIHRAALRALGSLGPGAEAAAPEIAAHLDRSPAIAFRALVAVAPGAAATLEAVAPWFGGGKPGPAGEVAEVLDWARTLGARGVPVLLAALRSQRADRMPAAAAALARLGPAGEAALVEGTLSLDFNTATSSSGPWRRRGASPPGSSRRPASSPSTTGS
jgi:hypothetical protein